MKKGIESQPITSVKWINRNEIKPNNYNPNRVAPPELELLIISILEDGWTQPIVLNPDMTIVDGFHRWTVSGDKRIKEFTGELVPCVIVEFDEAHKMMSTIRHNRARGTHGVLDMGKIVKHMIEVEKLTGEEICAKLQMEDEEVERLASRVGLPIKVSIKATEAFAKGWVPGKGN